MPYSDFREPTAEEIAANKAYSEWRVELNARIAVAATFVINEYWVYNLASNVEMRYERVEGKFRRVYYSKI